jgi:TatD DNase family protein
MEALFDSHTHLQLPAFAKDRAAVLGRARAAGVTGMIVVGMDDADSQEALILAAQHEEIHAAIGFHPHEAKHLNREALRMLRELAASPEVIALGEIGLDFYRDLSPRETQSRAFREQLELAAELKLPVIIHSREAQAETYAILRDWTESAGKSTLPSPVGVMHCFSGDLELAQRYIEMEFLISVAGNVTYPNANRLQAVASALPLEYLLVETDCPFLPTQEHRGARCEPSYLSETVDQIAALRNVSRQAVAAATTENARRLYRLDREDQASTAGERE